MRLRDLEKNQSGAGWLKRHKLLCGVGVLGVVAGFSLLQGFQAVQHDPGLRSSARSQPSQARPAVAQSPIVARVRVTEGTLRACGDTRVVRLLELRESGRGSETIQREQVGCSRETGGQAMHRVVARFQLGKQAFAVPANSVAGLIQAMGREIDQVVAPAPQPKGRLRGHPVSMAVMLSDEDHGIQIWWGKGAYQEHRSKTASGSGDGFARSITLPTYQARGERGEALFDELVRLVSEGASLDQGRRVMR